VLILSIFNINEPVIYGLPIMFNPILIIPFLLVPVFSLVIAYFATYIGWVPPVSEVMSWMTPPLVSGYIGTGNSVEGALLQLVIIILGVLAYRPFLKQMEDFGTVSNIFSNSVSKAFTNEPQHDLSTQSISAFVPQLSNNISAQKLLTKLRDTGEFILYYQPQYDIQTQRVIGVEALIRHKSETGVITPPYFLTAFSRLDLMQELDLWVIEKTLSEMEIFCEEPNFKISINISPDTLLINNFDLHVKKLLGQSKINVNQVELEITEDVLVKDEHKTKIVVDSLRAMGITIALDDFGSGFSSLGHLCKFEFDKVKIDRSFVLNLSTEKGQEVFRLTCQLVKVGGASVVVEGVEEQSELDFISEQGVSIVQGFYFYKPMPFSELIQLNQFNNMKVLRQ
ncbi:EAL domain-containing protein, partial [Vibrio makurazakiensis]|uniref:EAL domain-containing protein n=1 Tax=Vibrio makurazakiensis TaxID=2910250 RepID=UPI003D0B3E1E